MEKEEEEGEEGDEEEEENLKEEEVDEEEETAEEEEDECIECKFYEGNETKKCSEERNPRTLRLDSRATS